MQTGVHLASYPPLIQFGSSGARSSSSRPHMNCQGLRGVPVLTPWTPSVPSYCPLSSPYHLPPFIQNASLLFSNWLPRKDPLNSKLMPDKVQTIASVRPEAGRGEWGQRFQRLQRFLPSGSLQLSGGTDTGGISAEQGPSQM